MISGIGVDIVENARIERALKRWGQRFLDKAFTPREQAFCSQRKRPVDHYAIRFAAKESFAKAVKTGLRRGVYLKDIEMLHMASGEPYLVLYGRAKTILEELGIKKVHVSASHERGHSIAVVILER